jgi:hypothetical protein
MKGGVLKKSTFTGTYTVNPDGSGSMSVIVGGDSAQNAFALNSVTATGQAKGFQFLVTNSSNGNGNIAISGVALKQ